MKKKSLQIQSSYYSALILSLHCTSLSIIVLSQPHPACLSHQGTSNCLPASECHMMSFTKGKALLPGGIWQHVPHSYWGMEIPGSDSSLLGHHFVKNMTQGNLNTWWFCSFQNGWLISQVFLSRPSISRIYGKGVQS